MRVPFRRHRRGKLARADSEWDRLAQLLAHHAITLIVDVGANEGQYGERLRRYGYADRIVSFEPGAKAHETLSDRARADPCWDVVQRVALGSEAGPGHLRTGNRSDMNSLLPATDATQRAFPKLEISDEEAVQVVRLDAVFHDLVAPAAADNVFLKIDTQGYEKHVLAGAEGVLGRIAGLQVEMSLIPLYQGEPDYLTLLKRIHALGFAPHLVMSGFFSRVLARQLQIDGVFFRTDTPD